MKEKNLFIFDFDGVLTFSTQIGFQSLQAAAKQHKLNVPSDEQLKFHWGKSLEKEMFPVLSQELNWPHFKLQDLLQSFLEISTLQIYPLAPCLLQLLETLQFHKKDLAIVTNRDFNSLLFRSHQSGLDLKFFKDIVYPTNGLTKPNPEIFDHFWLKGYQPEDAVFIGDSINYDLAAANNHRPNLDFIAITSGLHSLQEFLEAGVPEHLILDSPGQIINLLN